MGDAGSLALGCAIVALTAELHLIWFLPVLGIVFVVEAASVVVNVTAIRRFGTARAARQPDPPSLRGARAARAAAGRCLRRLLRRSGPPSPCSSRTSRGRCRERASRSWSSARVAAVSRARATLVARRPSRRPRRSLRQPGDSRARRARCPSSVEVRLGGYPDDVAADALMVCPSPGVPWDAPELEVARAHGVPVRSEMDLVFERCRARICGITGTNGKTTTTALRRRDPRARRRARPSRREHRGDHARPPRRGRRHRLGGPRALVVPDRVGARAALRDRVRAQRHPRSPRPPRRLRGVRGDQATPRPLRAR